MRAQRRKKTLTKKENAHLVTQTIATKPCDEIQWCDDGEGGHIKVDEGTGR